VEGHKKELTPPKRGVVCATCACYDKKADEHQLQIKKARPHKIARQECSVEHNPYRIGGTAFDSSLVMTSSVRHGSVIILSKKQYFSGYVKLFLVIFNKFFQLIFQEN